MTSGGRRIGSGRKPKPENEKAKNVTFKLYEGEKEKIKEYIKLLRNSKESLQ